MFVLAKNKVKAQAHRISWKRLAILCAPLAALYAFFCPVLNEPLYALLAVRPNREYIDTNRPAKMGCYTGQHIFFPLLAKAGEKNKPDESTLLHGIYFKSASQPPRGTVIINPGNSFCLTHMLGCKPSLTILDLGYDLFVFDYEGFGESDGQADYKKLGNDALSAYKYVHDRLKASSIILYGMSMGSGVSSYVAERAPVDGIILDSPFISPERTAKDWFSILNIYPTQFFPEPRYDNSELLVGKHPPALIITKGCDAICWPTEGKELARRASPATMSIVLPNSQHLYVDSQDEPAYVNILKSFFAQSKSKSAKDLSATTCSVDKSLISRP